MSSRGTPTYPFKKDPDNFIGVTLENTYTIGSVQYEQVIKQAEHSAKRQFETEIRRLSRYFHNPKVHVGVVDHEVIEELNSRGKMTYRLHSWVAIEITEKNE